MHVISRCRCQDPRELSVCLHQILVGVRSKMEKETYDYLCKTRLYKLVCAHEILNNSSTDLTLCRDDMCVLLLHLAIIMLMNFFFLYILQIDDSIHITYRTEEMSNIFEASSNYSIMHQNRQSTSSSPTVTRRRYSHLFR